MTRTFRPGDPSFFGIEFEAEVVDVVSGQPLPIARGLATEVGGLLARGTSGEDMFASVFEYATGICASIDDARQDFENLWGELSPLLAARGASLLGMGMHPTAVVGEEVVGDDARYHGLVDTFQLAVRQVHTTGVHVHVGMPDGDTAIRVARQMRQFTPVLAALSASSPFSEGRPTGLASTRAYRWRSFPRSGKLPDVDSWIGYATYLDVLARSGAVTNPSDYWWEFRPKPDLGTLEIRIFDTVPMLSDVLGLASLAWCLSAALATKSMRPRSLHSGLVDENVWRAVRDGARAQFIVDEAGATRTVSEFAEELVTELVPTAEGLGCRNELEACLEMAAGRAPHQGFMTRYDIGGMEAVFASARVSW